MRTKANKWSGKSYLLTYLLKWRGEDGFEPFHNCMLTMSHCTNYTNSFTQRTAMMRFVFLQSTQRR